MKIICSKCSVKKPVTEFYAGGYDKTCKECKKAAARKYRLDNLAKVQAYDRQRANIPYRIKLRKEIDKRWKSDPKLRAITNERSKIWARTHKTERHARVVVGNAIRDGKLKKSHVKFAERRK